MEIESAKSCLREYEIELDEILSRFTHTRDAIHIASEDGSRFEQIVVELCDFYDDVFGRRIELR